MKVLLTGADGFLGWHTRVRLGALTGHEVIAVGRGAWDRLGELTKGLDAIIHVAGVNRGDDDEVEQANVKLASRVADAVLRQSRPTRIIFANSIQSGQDSPYGRGKYAASEILRDAAQVTGSHYVNVHLPNLFGEHGRPGYNSFVATFANAVDHGIPVWVEDRPVELLHAQTAAQVLIDALTEPSAEVRPAGTHTTVVEVYKRLREFHQVYRSGDLPDLSSVLDLDLFNLLRANDFPNSALIPLPPRTDARGSLVEVVRAHGGGGQTFVSTTKPGVTRGEHFHLHKVERFVVLSGQATIRLRKMYRPEIVEFEVDAATPVAIDMPTMWAHSITNTGTGDLTTLFWTNSLFDPAAPDTYPEPVGGSS